MVYLVVHEFEFRVGQQDLEKIFIFPDSQATAKNQKCNFNHINEFERPALFSCAPVSNKGEREWKSYYKQTSQILQK